MPGWAWLAGGGVGGGGWRGAWRSGRTSGRRLGQGGVGAGHLSYPLTRDRLNVVAPFPVRLSLEQISDAFRKNGWARLLDRCNGGGDLVLEAGLAQDAFGDVGADFLLDALVQFRLNHVGRRDEFAICGHLLVEPRDEFRRRHGIQFDAVRL